MKKLKAAPQKAIMLLTVLLFGIFLLFPMTIILIRSFFGDTGFTLEFYRKLFVEDNIGAAFLNSVVISAVSALITIILAFIPAYAINYTNINKSIKTGISTLMMFPMLLPTITYGFALIYSFGKQGLVTRIFGTQLLDIYGSGGLILGYVLYTLPISFMLINNTMGYIDKKFMIVSRMMGDSRLRCFLTTVIRPLIGTLAVSFVQSFALCFADYGIPASIAGNIKLVSTLLYNEMLGSLPNFNTGSALSIIMLLPSVASILIIFFLNKYNIRYSKISVTELEKNRIRDIVFGILSVLLIICVLSVFAVIFIVPFVEQWPYRINFSFEHIVSIFSDGSVVLAYKNSIIVSLATALFGTVAVYCMALVSARHGSHKKLGVIPDTVSHITNTIPGMVLGVAYLLSFKGTALHNGFIILIICNFVHYFSSPYHMMKSGLEKLNASWETTARLMGDSWIKTVVRIITPNAWRTILEVFGYIFVNSMVTVSAVVFLTGAGTIVATVKIKELQHFANFNEIFVLSILMLLTNLLINVVVKFIVANKQKRGMKK